MNTRLFSCGIFAIFLASGLSAAGTQLTEGMYVSNLSPRVNEIQADKIENQLEHIEEIHFVDVKPGDSTLYYTVKDDSRVDLSRITEAVQAAVPNMKVSKPTLAPER